MCLSAYRGLVALLLALSYAHSAVAQTAVATLPDCSRIMPLGDSITVGGNGGYRKDLYFGLLNRSCGESFVGTQYDQYTPIPEKLHEGHPYFTIDDIAKGIDGWLAASQPNIILLIIGTNDIASWTESSAEEIGARLNALLGRIRRAQPDVWIFVASIPPMSPGSVPPKNIERSVLTAQYNSVVRDNVEKRADTRIRFVDVNAALSVDDLADGIHPKEEAQAKIAEKFLTAIDGVLKLGSTPVASVPTTPTPTSPPTQAAPTSPAPISTPPPSAPIAASSSGGATSGRFLLLLMAVLLMRVRIPDGCASIDRRAG
jgi:hypothetical protein